MKKQLKQKEFLMIAQIFSLELFNFNKNILLISFFKIVKVSKLIVKKVLINHFQQHQILYERAKQIFI